MAAAGSRHVEVPPRGESKSAPPPPPAIPSFRKKCRPPEKFHPGAMPPRPAPFSGPQHYVTVTILYLRMFKKLRSWVLLRFCHNALFIGDLHRLKQLFPTFSVSWSLLTIWLKAVGPGDIYKLLDIPAWEFLDIPAWAPLIKRVNTITYRQKSWMFHITE